MQIADRAAINVTLCLLADELDSFMYQTVGHQGIEMLAEAMELPLFRKTTSGLTTQMGKNYEPTEDDEVEDLYALLKQVKVSATIDTASIVLLTIFTISRIRFTSRLWLLAQSFRTTSESDARMCKSLNKPGIRIDT